MAGARNFALVRPFNDTKDPESALEEALQTVSRRCGALIPPGNAWREEGAAFSMSERLPLIVDTFYWSRPRSGLSLCHGGGGSSGQGA